MSLEVMLGLCSMMAASNSPTREILAKTIRTNEKVS